MWYDVMAQTQDPHKLAILRNSSQLGDRLLRLYRKDCPASKEFLCIGHEIKAFHASYLIVRTYLQPPSFLISQIGATLVHNIHDGVETICENIGDDIRTFKEDCNKASRARERSFNSFLVGHSGGMSPKDRNKRIQKFLQLNDSYALERSQLRYGNMLLNLIIAVIVYAQNVHDKAAATFPDHSAYLIADLYTALTELRSQERREKKARRTDTLPVEASWWWDGLPPQTPNVPQMTPLAELALVWVSPEGRLASQPNPKITEFQDIIGRWRDQNQQMRRNLQGLDGAYREAVATSRQLYSDNVQVTRDNEQLQKDNNNFKASISRLNENITRLIDELQAEREARQSQEQQTAHFRSQHAGVQTQYNRLFAEKEAAERLATRARRAHNEVLRDFEKESRRRDRSTERQRSIRSRPTRTNEGPPMAFETQRRRRKRMPCVVCKPTDCCADCGKANKWTGTRIVVDELDGNSPFSELPADAPPVHYATRPYRTL